MKRIISMAVVLVITMAAMAQKGELQAHDAAPSRSLGAVRRKAAQDEEREKGPRRGESGSRVHPRRRSGEGRGNPYGRIKEKTER